MSYLWAVTHGEVLSISLAYFVCPVTSIVLGTVVCRERLTGGQLFAVVAICFEVLFIAAVIYFGEPIIAHDITSFSLIWLGIALFLIRGDSR